MVEIARMAHGVEHRRARDFVEHHPLDVDPFQRLALLQHLAHVPRDRLALAVGVGRQIEMLGALERLGDVADALLRLRLALPVHGEVLVRAHAAVLGRQVAHVAEAGQDRVVLAQVLVDRLRLGGRFDDDDVHGDFPVGSAPASCRDRRSPRPYSRATLPPAWRLRRPASSSSRRAA